ncbi:hypothetical protein HDU67_007361 [Dinochytrium kinnereticum]|nr:hypothetical protein HDU67_007361 [Dinochytrium kinnereticum]
MQPASPEFQLRHAPSAHPDNIRRFRRERHSTDSEATCVSSTSYPEYGSHRRLSAASTLSSTTTSEISPLSSISGSANAKSIEDLLKQIDEDVSNVCEALSHLDSFPHVASSLLHVQDSVLAGDPAPTLYTFDSERDTNSGISLISSSTARVSLLSAPNLTTSTASPRTPPLAMLRTKVEDPFSARSALSSPTRSTYDEESVNNVEIVIELTPLLRRLPLTAQRAVTEDVRRRTASSFSLMDASASLFGRRPTPSSSTSRPELTVKTVKIANNDQTWKPLIADMGFIDPVRTAVVAATLPALFTVLYAASSKERLVSVFMTIFNSPAGYYLYRLLAPKGPKDGHSKVVKEYNEFEAGPFRIIPVPFAEDNYGYICLDTEENTAVVIDPADPDRIRSILLKNAKQANDTPLTLKAILNTHHHWDHSAGNARLLSWARRNQRSAVDVYGSEVDFPKFSLSNLLFRRVNQRVKDGDEFKVGRMVFRTITVPCHTKGSVIFAFDVQKSMSGLSPVAARTEIPEPWSDPSSPSASRVSLTEQDANLTFFAMPGITKRLERSIPVSLFTGDAVFVGGTGRFFEGTPEDMQAVVRKLIETTPPNALIWPGHEYALQNLTFANELEPSNIFIQDNHFNGISAVPSIWSSELETNPYFRLDIKSRSGELWSNVVSRMEEKKLDVKATKVPDVTVAARIARPAAIRNPEKENITDEALSVGAVQVLGALRWLKDGYKMKVAGEEKK